MKLKATVTESAPEKLLAILDSSEVADGFRDIVCEHLGVEPNDFGPATHYVQKTDLTIPTSDSKLGIEVTLSKVSVNDNRSHCDFLRALTAVQEMYESLISRNAPCGTSVQLFCVLALDQPIKFQGKEPTSLIELDPIDVEGLAGKRFNTKPSSL